MTPGRICKTKMTRPEAPAGQMEFAELNRVPSYHTGTGWLAAIHNPICSQLLRCAPSHFGLHAGAKHRAPASLTEATWAMVREYLLDCHSEIYRSREASSVEAENQVCPAERPRR